MERQVTSKLVYSIVHFLRSQLDAAQSSSEILSEEGAESVEVALQCLETAYGVSESPHLSVSRNLYDIFKEGIANESPINRPTLGLSPPTTEEKEEAERLKNEGNALMRQEKFDLALDTYTKAITKDRTNAVYYCNRAAAHSKLNNHQEAIDDCKKALNIEPNYSKAYGRMGLAYSALQNAFQAKQCYELALEIEPDNESYRGNLAIAEEKLQSQSTQQSSTPSSSNQAAGFNPFSAIGGGGGGGGSLLGNLGGMAGSGGGGGGGGGGAAPDVQGLFSNPALMNMATQLMQDPNIQNMMSSFLGGSGPAPPSQPPVVPPPPVTTETTPTTTSPSAGPGSMEALLTAGRQLAEQMQAQHPDLVEQLRSQMGRGGNPDDANNQDPPGST